MADCKSAKSREEVAGQARPWPPMPPHPSQLTVVAQLATSQVSPLLPPVITVSDPVDTAQIFVVIQEIQADMQQMRVDMQTQHLVLQDHA
jgi:hypothetical protein